MGSCSDVSGSSFFCVSGEDEARETRAYTSPFMLYESEGDAMIRCTKPLFATCQRLAQTGYAQGEGIGFNTGSCSERNQ